VNSELDILRSFRDNILFATKPGGWLVNIYYSTSPPIANVLSQNELTKTATRTLLVVPATIAVGTLMEPLGLLFILGIGTATIVLSRKFGVLRVVLKGIGYATITLLTEISIIFLLGATSNIWVGFPTIATYILPLIIPLSLSIFILTLIYGIPNFSKKCLSMLLKMKNKCFG